MFQSINNTSSLSTEFDKDIMRHTRTSEFRSRIEREQSHIDSLNHDQLRYWIINNSKLPDAISIANKLFDQCIDGKLLVDMTENDFSQLGLNFRSRNLLRSISNSQNEVCKTIETKSPKEYKIINGKALVPVGNMNDRISLSKRPSSSGIQPISAGASVEDIMGHHIIRVTSSVSSYHQASLRFTHDENTDMFQIGRCNSGVNDISIPGPVYEDSPRAIGPVSKYACRVVCQREYPYKSFLLSGGFNKYKEMNVLGDSYSPSSEHGQIDIDAFIPNGVRVRCPRTGKWNDVSVMGTARSSDGMLGVCELQDGAIIDIGGPLLLFEKHKQSAIDTVPFSSFVQSINKMRPQCPVMMHTIKFPELTTLKEHNLQIWNAVKNGTINLTPTSVTSSPHHACGSDPNCVDDEKQPCVYVACGHVFGYSKELREKPCPLCRCKGPFVPVSIPSRNVLCSSKPTHVFNPCGHAASEQTCQKWASIGLPQIFPRNCSTLMPSCPFCCCKLVLDPKKGGPYNKLIMHFENQYSHECDDMDCEEQQELCVSSDEEDDCEQITLLSLNFKSNQKNMALKSLR